jgi:hypothetical protein
MVDYEENGYVSPREAIVPLVKQCRYSGIFVPDNCVEGVVFGYKKPYSQNNKDVKSAEELIDKAVELVGNLVNEIKKRKKD